VGHGDQKLSVRVVARPHSKATKHFPESEETAKGHGRKTRSGLRLTKKTGSADSTDDNDNDEDTVCINPPPRSTTRTRKIFYVVNNLEDEAQLKMYTDQTGRFPKKSSRGNQYIMVLIEQSWWRQ